MRRQEFMDALGARLAALGRTPQEVADILADFEEHVAAGVAGGRSEEDVVAGLGSPEALAAQYADEGAAPSPGSSAPGAAAPPPSLAPAQPAVTARGVGRGIFAVIALLFFDLIVVLPVLATLLAVVLSLWAAALSIGAAGLACVVGAFFLPVVAFVGLPGVFVIFLGIALLALCVLACIGMYYVSKGFALLVKAIFVAQARIVKGGSRS